MRLRLPFVVPAFLTVLAFASRAEAKAPRHAEAVRLAARDVKSFAQESQSAIDVRVNDDGSELIVGCKRDMRGIAVLLLVRRDESTQSLRIACSNDGISADEAAPIVGWIMKPAPLAQAAVARLGVASVQQVARVGELAVTTSAPPSQSAAAAAAVASR